MTGRRVFVLGDLIIDRTIHCTVRGISQEAAVIHADQDSPEVLTLGGAGNVARNLKSLGAEATFLALLGRTGPDKDGHLLATSTIDQAGVASFCDLVDGQQSVKTRYLSACGHLFRIDADAHIDVPGGYWVSESSPLPLILKGAVAGTPAVFCLVDHGKGYFDRLAGVGCFNYLRRYFPDSELVVDPGMKGAWERFGSEKTIFKANVKQCIALGNVANGAVDCWQDGVYDPMHVYSAQYYQFVANNVERNLLRIGCEHDLLWITLGAGGSILVDRRSKPLYLPVAPVPVADTVGAGDSAMAGFVRQLAWGAPLRPSCDERVAVYSHMVRYANTVARIAVQHPGPYAVRAEDL